MTASANRFAGRLLAVGLFCLCACGGESPSAGVAPERVYKVEVMPALSEDVAVRLSAVGTVVASAHAAISPQVDGLVSEIVYDRGSRVETGETLIRLDDRKAAASVALAAATLDNARALQRVSARNLVRARDLIEDELISLEEFETLEAVEMANAAAVRQQEASLTLAERRLEDYHITAPFSGVVGSRLVDAGNFVKSGTELVVLVKTDPIEIDFRVPDRHAGDLGIGMSINVTPTSGGATLEGTITFINPRVSQSTRMLQLRASVPNPGDGLRDGQFVEVSILAGVREDQVVIPEQAVLFTTGKTFVFVIEDDHAVRREVSLGERRPPSVEVLSGIEANVTVVVGGQHRLSDGAAVEVMAGTDGT